MDVREDGIEVIRSPNFPECCSKAEYRITYVGGGTGYIRMVFEDIDLPPGSELTVKPGFTLSLV